jgi:predicted transcriptional regulator of viral defense system
MMDTSFNDGPARTEWRYELLGLLESNEAPRVCTTEELAQLVRRVRPRANADTVHNAIGGLMKAGALQKVSRGLYLNRRSRPAVEVAEAAQHIRQGAVVSLESVLGECGFLNNPPAIVTAVVPQRPDSVPRVG